MMREFLIGATQQAIARVRSLQGMVDKTRPREIADLRRICTERLERLALQFEQLATNIQTVWDADPKIHLRDFRRLQMDLFRVEHQGVLALDRTNEDDVFLNQLLDRICQNIGYPLNIPTISHTSKDYFVINCDFNLISVPPAESHTLLHLADLYHELGHPLLSRRNERKPATAPLALQFALSAKAQDVALEKQIRHVDRISGPDLDKIRLNTWRTSWANGWFEEFYCDLFATFWLGPAYGWSHLNLCLKLDRSPFSTPVYKATSHPPDDARMQAILLALNELEFQSEAAEIDEAWIQFCRLREAKRDMRYGQAFPESAIRMVFEAAIEGFMALKSTPCSPSEMTEIAACLNQAWAAFRASPSSYPTWEAQAINRLKTSL